MGVSVNESIIQPYYHLSKADYSSERVKNKITMINGD